MLFWRGSLLFRLLVLARRMSKNRGPDWSRPLPRTLIIPKVMTLATLADVQELMRHLPEHHRQRPTWRHVAGQLEEAANGGDQKGIGTALVLVLTLEGIEWHPKSDPRRFPPPWTVEETQACFVVKVRTGKSWPTSTSRTSPADKRRRTSSRAMRPGASQPTSPSCQKLLLKNKRFIIGVDDAGKPNTTFSALKIVAFKTTSVDFKFAAST